MGSSSKTVTIVLVFIFLISLVTLQPIAVKAASSRTITFPDDYATIQAAIDNASPGDTIFVRRGVYNESIVVDKPLLLIGEDNSTTIIDGQGMGTVIQITSNNVQVANFTVRNAGTSAWLGHGFPDSCINVEDSNDVTVTNSILSNATVGIWSYASTNVSSNENFVTNTTTMGIVDYACTNCSIGNNFLQNCGIGVHLDGSSTSCRITNNTIVNCGEGIDIEKSMKNMLNQNKLLNNNASVVFSECNGNSMQYCLLENNSIGIGFLQSNGNSFCYNSFIDNEKQVVSDFYSLPSDALSANKWDNGKEGNYWSDYLSKHPNATEVDSSGIGNTPYGIDANNTDHYPLTHQVYLNAIAPTPKVPEFPLLIVTQLILILLISASVLVYFKIRKRVRIL